MHWAGRKTLTILLAQLSGDEPGPDLRTFSMISYPGGPGGYGVGFLLVNNRFVHFDPSDT
jgi:hypothetical protein